VEVVHPDATGTDVGGSDHWVAVSPDRDPEPVRRFGCFTADLREMGRWLVQKGVRSVAMQSTGVYWMPVFEVLEQQGLEVYLVNAQHTKNVPGRKSDVQECQWLLKLHAFGLLNNSFQPSDEIRIARTPWCQRSNLVAEAVGWDLCPTNEQSGGQILNRRTRKVVNRASTAFRPGYRTARSPGESPGSRRPSRTHPD
jgi:hypothetical protein